MHVVLHNVLYFSFWFTFSTYKHLLIKQSSIPGPKPLLIDLDVIVVKSNISAKSEYSVLFAFTLLASSCTEIVSYSFKLPAPKKWTFNPVQHLVLKRIPYLINKLQTCSWRCWRLVRNSNNCTFPLQNLTFNLLNNLVLWKFPTWSTNSKLALGEVDER